MDRDLRATKSCGLQICTALPQKQMHGGAMNKFLSIQLHQMSLYMTHGTAHWQ
jgi:hypothetical protein